MATENVGGIQYTVDADTAAMLKAEAVVKKSSTSMSNSLKSADTSVKQFNTSVTKSAAGVKRGVQANLGQAGIQVQQFVGQLQGGQSAMVALAQQSADLGIVLGAPLVGVVVSLAAVLIGTLAPALFDSGKKVDELREKLEKLVEANTLTREQADVLITAEEKKNKEREKSIKKLKEEQVTLKSRLTLSQNTIKNYDKESEVYKNLIKGQKDLKNQMDINVSSQQVLNLEIATSTDKIKTYNAAVSKEQVPVTKEQKSAIDSLVSSIKSEVETLGMSARGVALYSAEQILNTEAQKDNLAAVKDRINASFDTIEAYKKESDAIKQTASDLEWYEQQLQAIDDKNISFAQGIIESGKSPTERMQEQYKQLDELRKTDLENAQVYTDAMIALDKKMAEDKVGFLSKAFGNLDTQIAGTMASVVLGAQDGESALKSLATTILTQVVGAIIQQGIASVFASQTAAKGQTAANAEILATAAPTASAVSLATAGANSLPAVAGIAAVTAAMAGISSIAGAREFGGPVTAGKSYLVGERGPEMFTPSTSGGIVSNKDMQGGGSGVSVNINNYSGQEVTQNYDEINKIVNIAIGKQIKGVRSGTGDLAKALKSTTTNKNRATAR